MFSGRGASLLRSASSKLHRRTTHPALSFASQLLFSTTNGAPARDNPGDEAHAGGSNRDPPPIQVLLTESAGRGVFATRRIGASELIHTAKPLVAHPSPSVLHDVCYFCLRRLRGGGSGNTTLPAAEGRVYRFCSQSCREQSEGFCDVEKRANWSSYDDHCKSRGLKYPFLVKRLACMIISGTTSADGIDILQPASLTPEMIAQMETEFELLRCTFLEARIEDDLIAFLTKHWYFGVLARIRINAFRIELAGGSYEDLLTSAAASVAAEASIGNAVYILSSFYNHDCDPNAHIIWVDNVDAKLKALRDIEKDEELRICYIDASMVRNARQRLLSEGFGFQCQCPRCMSGD